MNATDAHLTCDKQLVEPSRDGIQRLAVQPEASEDFIVGTDTPRQGADNVAQLLSPFCDASTKVRRSHEDDGEARLPNIQALGLMLQQACFVQCSLDQNTAEAVGDEDDRSTLAVSSIERKLVHEIFRMLRDGHAVCCALIEMCRIRVVAVHHDPGGGEGFGK